MKQNISYNPPTMAQHIMEFTKKAPQYVSGDKLEQVVERYINACVEYYEYKNEISKIETFNYIILPKNLKKIKDYYGSDVYSLINRPLRMFPRQTRRSDELRQLLDYNRGKYSNDKIKAIDFERLYKLFNIVHCHSNSWDIEDHCLELF